MTDAPSEWKPHAKCGSKFGAHSRPACRAKSGAHAKAFNDTLHATTCKSRSDLASRGRIGHDWLVAQQKGRNTGKIEEITGLAWRVGNVERSPACSGRDDSSHFFYDERQDGPQT